MGPEGTRMAILYIYPKVGEPTTYPLGASRVAIGRASSNDIVLSDQFSSGVHAVIVQTPRGQ
jgi:pSer/pThr/pTyr-binding forkhead associated (FHA) protein